MRHNPKRAGLLLIVVLGAIGLVTWCRHDRTGDVSSSIPASSAASSPIATSAGSSAIAEAPTPAAPPADLPVASVAEAPPREAPNPTRADVASTMRGGAVRRATGARKAKVLEAEPQNSAPVVAQAQGESSDRPDAGARAEPTPEAAQPPPPPKETGLLVGRFHNSVGSTFRLTRVSFEVDGSPVVVQDFPNGLESGADVAIFERRVDVGDHALQVVVEYRGNSGEVFSYFDRYGYKVSSRRTFTSTAKTTTQLTVVGYEKGGVLTSFENRLGVGVRVASTP